MRVALGFLLVVGSFLLVAQESREVVVARLLAEKRTDDLEFGVTIEKGTVEGGKASIPVVVTVPVEQLRFVDNGTQLVAKVAVLEVADGRIVRVLEESRVTAPRATVPVGETIARFELSAAGGAETRSILVLDEHGGMAGMESISILGATARAGSGDAALAADTAWRELLARASAEQKPVVVLFRTRPCGPCRRLERDSLAHPTIQRRLPSVVFGVLPADAGEASKLWASHDAGMALFDRAGVLRARWPIVPDTMNFGILLDSVRAVAQQFERAVQLAESGAPHDADLEAGIGLGRLRRVTDARAALARARAHGSAETRQRATVALALLDSSEGKGKRALPELEQVAASAVSPAIAVEAQTALEIVRAALQPASDAAGSGAIRILPFERQLVTGRHTVRTHVVSAAVARVVFSLDGREVRRVTRPPFSAALDFGTVPERHAVRVVAFDRRGKEVGRDERVANEAGETFWLRLVAPLEGAASGPVRAMMNVRVPAARRILRVVLSWNDAERAVLTAAPWEASVNIPAGQVGVLRAVAELDDGRTSEDAVLLNAGGAAGRADVQLVELPITVVSRNGAIPEITPARIRVREGALPRRVESVATAAETPLTVGLLIDVSGSMQKTLPDVQEAAIRFLDTVLGERDRAFIVTFDTGARLVQPATSNRALLRRQIMSIRPDGLTALNDAMVLGLLQFEGIKGRRAMVVFSDGVDITSRYAPAEVGELARRVNVPIHLIASIQGVPATLNAAAASAAMPAEAGELPAVARSTGGTSHVLDNLAGLPAVYARIEAALRAQILAFVRTDPGTRENEWRSVRIEVEGKGLEVYAPAGYYAHW